MTPNPDPDFDGWQVEPTRKVSHPFIPGGVLVHRPLLASSASYLVEQWPDGIRVLRRWPWSPLQRLTPTELAGLMADTTRPGRNRALQAALNFGAGNRLEAEARDLRANATHLRRAADSEWSGSRQGDLHRRACDSDTEAASIEGRMKRLRSGLEPAEGAAVAPPAL